jgi:hypothetical protein
MVDDEGIDLGEEEVVERVEDKVCGEAEGRLRVITGGRAVMALGDVCLSAIAMPLSRILGSRQSMCGQ